MPLSSNIAVECLVDVTLPWYSSYRLRRVMEPSLALPEDDRITDPETRKWVEATRRAAAQGALLAQSFGETEMRDYFEQERRRLRP